MENAAKTRTVGLFGLVGLVIIGFLMANFSRGGAFWKRRFDITVKAEGVGGLKPGAFVLMSGVQVGIVKNMQLAPDGRNVFIDCEIEDTVEIFPDARFEIEQSGFLGDQYVSITPTANKGSRLRQGAAVIATKPFNMTEAVRGAVSLMQRLEGAAKRLDDALARIDSAVLTDATFANITNTVVNVRRVSERAESAILAVEDLIRTNAGVIQGSISNAYVFSGRLNQVADKIDGVMQQAAGVVNQVTGVVAHVDGVVANADSLITSNRADIQATIANAQAATAEIKNLAVEIQSGRGPIGLLLKDPGTRLQLQGISQNLAVLSSNLSRHGIFWKPREVAPLNENSLYKGRSPF